MAAIIHNGRISEHRQVSIAFLEFLYASKIQQLFILLVVYAWVIKPSLAIRDQ